MFGAGAEANFGICTGENFAKAILGLDGTADVELMKQGIKTYYQSKDKLNGYPSYKFQPYQRDSLLKNAIRKELMDGNRVYDTSKEYEDYIRDEINAFQENKKIDFIYQHINYMGLLDRDFHTLISPKALGPNRFWRLITLYNLAYLAICKEVLKLKITDEMDIVTILNNPKETYKSIVETIRSEKRFQEPSYYSAIQALLKNNVKVITTNYTPIAEQIIGMERNNIAYLHGNLSWFECPNNLTVYDVAGDDAEDLNDLLIFPYIFLQSGVKPIVDTIQLREYAKMLDILDNTNSLFVLGYNFNLDDNHINSFIRAYVRKKKLIYFAYKCEDITATREAIQHKLHIKTNENITVVPICSTPDFEKGLQQYLIC